MAKGPSASPAGSGRGGRGPERPAPRSASRRKRERRKTGATTRGPSHQPFWRRRRTLAGAATAAVAAVVVIVVVLATRGTGTSAKPNPSPTTAPTATPAPTPPSLAGLSGGGGGQTIDGIQCQAQEQVVYHIHAHLAIFVNGSPRSVPEGIGIPPPRRTVDTDEGPFVEAGKCYYWLHAHTGDGIIHIESPTQSTYTLGQYFDIWGEPLSTTQVGPATGTVIAYVNGQKFTGDPRSITLTAHGLIQLDVGQDVFPTSFAFPPGL